MKATKEQQQEIIKGFDTARRFVINEMFDRQCNFVSIVETFDFLAISKLDASLGRDLLIDTLKQLIAELHISAQVDDILANPDNNR